MEPDLSDFTQEIEKICMLAISRVTRKKLCFTPMQRRNRVNPKRGFVVGRTNLKTGSITIDILTPVKREPKKPSSILRTLCHEIAHHQKMPYYQRYKGKWIVRQHYPAFYKQVNKNIETLEKDERFGSFFRYMA